MAAAEEAEAAIGDEIAEDDADEEPILERFSPVGAIVPVLRQEQQRAGWWPTNTASASATSSSSSHLAATAVPPAWCQTTDQAGVCCWEAIAAMTYARRWKGCVVAMLGDGTMLGMYPVVTSDLLRELIHRSDAPPPRYLREIVASYHNDHGMSGGEGSPNWRGGASSRRLAAGGGGGWWGPLTRKAAEEMR